ncbi:signal peptidase I [Desulfosediminicola ganghwensis]|uniref:signal peptidase I n=1 Tax=Desulfosediminicola ganghwensis TaxID=2569540 RepID=UPI00142EC84C|nr:signal peptidase I [Desulfosediminicola ganghwensis]
MSKEFVHLIEDIFSLRTAIIVKSNGGSMQPTIPRDAVVKLEPIDIQQIRVGDIVVYEADSTRTVMHRVFRKFRRKGTGFVQTWGDNVAVPDAPVPTRSVKARVEAYNADGEWVQLPPVSSLAQLSVMLRYVIVRLKLKTGFMNA